MTQLLTPAEIREHVETDLLDPALERLIDDADAAIVARFGAHAADGSVVEEHAGGFSIFFPSRPAASITVIAEFVGEPSTVLDGAMTAPGTTLTSATAGFVAGDVGKYVEVAGAAAAGGMLRTTITTFISATQVTLATAAATTVAGATVTYGGTKLDASDYELRNGGREIRRRTGGTNSRGTWTDPVRLVYTPVDDAARRRRIELDLVKLAVHYEASKSQAVGDHTESSVEYEDERERILDELSPALALT